MKEFHRPKSDNGECDEILTVGTSGGLNADNAFETISLFHSQVFIGELPYFAKVPKIREVI